MTRLKSRIKMLGTAFCVLASLLIYGFIPAAEATRSGLRDPFSTVRPFGRPGESIMELASGDMDGDGDLDLVAHQSIDRVAIYLNDGDSNFRDSETVALNLHKSDHIRQVEIADMNRDGFLDLAIATEQALIFRFNTGMGHFPIDQALDLRLNDLAPEQSNELSGRLAISKIAIGDLNGDEVFDIVVGLRAYASGPSDANQPGYLTQPGYRILLNNVHQPGTFLRGKSIMLRPDTANFKEVTLAHMDSNSSLDIVFSNSVESWVYLNDGSAANFNDTPPLTVSYPIDLKGYGADSSSRQLDSVTVGDMDGDGTTDLIVASQILSAVDWADSTYLKSTILNSTCRVLYNNGEGLLSTGQQTGFPCDLTELSVGDINGDRALDIVAVSYHGNDRIYLNDGYGGFSLERSIMFGTVTGASFAVALVDLNNDGALDLAMGNYAPHLSAVYLNDLTAGITDSDSVWLGGAYHHAPVIGDLDSDGRPETILMMDFDSILIQRLDKDGHLEAYQTWRPPADFRSVWSGLSAVLADANGDTYLDLIVAGSAISQNLTLLNNGSGQLGSETIAFGPLSEMFVAGDLNHDGFTDLVGVESHPDVEVQSSPRIVVYLNSGTGYNMASDFVSTPSSGDWEVQPGALALGDVNGDGFADLVVAGTETDSSGSRVSSDFILFNDGHGGFKRSRSAAFGAGSNHTTQIALGDIDGDGALDIVAGKEGQSFVYRNDGTGEFPLRLSTPIGPRTYDTRSVAVGDINGDKYLDVLLVGLTGNARDVNVFLNDGRGELSDSRRVANPLSPGAFQPMLALADLNNDGLLDLVMVGTNAPGVILFNTTGSDSKTEPSPLRVIVKVPSRTQPKACAPGSPEADGTIPIPYELFAKDLTEIREIRAWYSPNGGGQWYAAQPTTKTVTTNFGTNQTRTFCWDTLASGFFGQSDNVIFRIEAYPSLKPGRHGVPGPYRWPYVAAQSIPFGARGAQLRTVDIQQQPAESAMVYQLGANMLQGGRPLGPIQQPLRTDSQGYLIGRGTVALRDRLTALYPTDVISPHTPTRLYFSQDGFPMTVTGTQTVTASLAITDIRRIADLDVLLDITHTVGSDLRATLVAPDGMERALFTTTATLKDNLIAFSFDDQATGAFGQQTITETARPVEPFGLLNGRPLDGAWTLRLENRGQGAASTLNGWGLALKVSDLFYTSAQPTIQGLAMYTMTAGGVQTLTVSSAYPLLLFDLDVALEWDARNDSKYLAQLKFDLKRASEVLYDWTDGQVALGRIRVFHDAKRNTFSGYGDPWGEADIRIYATNRLRPSAVQGGIVSEPFTDPMQRPYARVPNVYTPGQVTIGAVWNRFGDSSGNLGEDWARTLAHELGHYLLFLDDNYLGMNETGMLMTVDSCSGAMADHYRDDSTNGYGEFHTDANWLTECEATLSAQRTGRSDWQTIETFYPALRKPADSRPLAGPATLPLDLTQVDFVEPISPTRSLIAPVISHKYGGRATAQTANARAFLFKANDEWLVDLGRPQLDQVVARGAEASDRLCVFDLIQDHISCRDVDSSGNPELTIQDSTWKPQIRIVPAGVDRLRVEVTGVDSNELHVRLFPQDFPASAAKQLEPGIVEGERNSTVFSATFPLTETAGSGHIHVWAGTKPDGSREIVTDYALGGLPSFGEEFDLPRQNAVALDREDAGAVAGENAVALDREDTFAFRREDAFPLPGQDTLLCFGHVQ